jgi:hypothetical protein
MQVLDFAQENLDAPQHGTILSPIICEGHRFPMSRPVGCPTLNLKGKHMSYKDYSILLEENTGRRFTIYINGDSIDALGGNDLAVEAVEGSAFEKVIVEGNIVPDAYRIDNLEA